MSAEFINIDIIPDAEGKDRSVILRVSDISDIFFNGVTATITTKQNVMYSLTKHQYHQLVHELTSPRSGCVIEDSLSNECNIEDSVTTELDSIDDTSISIQEDPTTGNRTIS